MSFRREMEATFHPPMKERPAPRSAIAGTAQLPHHARAMPTPSRAIRRLLTLAIPMVALLVACGVDAAGPRRVLLIHSFSRDFAPFDQVAAVFRTELARQSPGPVILYEANLDLGRVASERERDAFVECLRARTMRPQTRW